MVELKCYEPLMDDVLAPFVVGFWDVHHSNVATEEAKQTLHGWAQGENQLFAIAADGSLVGFIRLHCSSRTVCWIDDIYVDAPVRGQGIATEAIRLAEAEMRAQGVRSFCMEVVPDNLPAMRLYHRLGYDRLSLITMRKDDESFETARTETIAGLPLRVKKFD